MGKYWVVGNAQLGKIQLLYDSLTIGSFAGDETLPQLGEYLWLGMDAKPFQ